MTPRQQLVLQELRRATEAHGRPPSLEEIAAALGRKPSGKSWVSETMTMLGGLGLAEKRGDKWWPTSAVIVHFRPAAFVFLEMRRRMTGAKDVAEVVRKLVDESLDARAERVRNEEREADGAGRRPGEQA